MFRVAVAVREIGFFLEEPRAVDQHDLAERRGAVRAIDRPAEALAHEHGQIAAVIEMRMREHDGVDRIGGHGQRAPVAQPQLLRALEQPAVDQDACPGVLEQILRAGDGFRRAEERQFHETSRNACGVRCAHCTTRDARLADVDQSARRSAGRRDEKGHERTKARVRARRGARIRRRRGCMKRMHGDAAARRNRRRHGRPPACGRWAARSTPAWGGGRSA
ncbi:hypothetical protein Y047_2766 [Burkholderia pseudomallei MSHR3016]|nr:hypothetical protein Y047_2766 [Burkholderia pseudomallei MSHR3016]